MPASISTVTGMPASISTVTGVPTSIATITRVPTVTRLPTIIKPKAETYIPTEEDRAQMKKESEEEETITVTGEQVTE